MTALSSFFAHAAFVQMAMCSLLLAPAWRSNRSVRLFSLLLLCGCAYLTDALFGPFTRLSGLWWVNHIGGNALAGVFWLVSLSVFADDSDLRPWQYGVASLTLVIPLTVSLLAVLTGIDLHGIPPLRDVVVYGAMALELVLIAHAMYVVVAHWHSDLVQERRYARGGVIGVTAAYLFSVIVIEQVLNLESIWLGAIKHAALSILMLGVYWFTFALREDGLLAQRLRPISGFERSPAPLTPELQTIRDAMLVDHLYREEGMTIARLARHLGIREYKLRQLINGQLGYRNFNDFLNHFRVEEVAARLRDPEHQGDTVLTLALDSGFRSLSSFNRAFKMAHGMTPTEYRGAMSN